MPGGDHLNIIDPPGLTVMRIAGGRYRVTAAHRVVWTWMNEFASISLDGGFGEESSSQKESLQIEDLVTLTIVVCAENTWTELFFTNFFVSCVRLNSMVI
mmetsp:Transcript_26774/g.29987  ORF Transcript_26774/g.29987 Transcript_26774/m.29987 type:complete len:100 (+) Transcript_26774:609-908(+)